MSGETEAEVSGWTTDTLRYHLHAIRECDLALDAERDRRYSEAATLRAEALQIKANADSEARILAREIQDGKDEKANNLREQIGSERGMYATKDDLAASNREFMAMMRPLADYVTSQVGRTEGITLSAKVLSGLLIACTSIVTLVVLLH